MHAIKLISFIKTAAVGKGTDGHHVTIPVRQAMENLSCNPGPVKDHSRWSHIPAMTHKTPTATYHDPGAISDIFKGVWPQWPL